ncbi:MAG TPA: hypothetical protein VNO33_03275, partial [Kofleriaceae bacterium]|nr:hypothetical protein [Kofleriaceae bacterium]
MLSTAAPRRAAAVVLSLTGLGLAGHVAPGWAAWAAPTSLTATGVLGVAVIAAVAALWSGTRHRRTVGAVLLLIGSALCALDAAGVSFAVASIGPAPYAILIAGATALAGIGILLRRRGARWLGLALAATGAMSSGINLAQWMLAGISDAYSWVLAVWTLGSLAVLFTLFGRDVAEEDRLAPHERVWARRDPLVRWMRAATVSAIAAVPMLIVY